MARGVNYQKPAPPTSAPANSPFLTYAPDGTLTNEIVLEPFEGRLSVAAIDQLLLERFNGSSCVVNGESIDPGAGGKVILVTANLIAADGTDAGAAPANSTLYRVYLSNSAASFSPSSIRLCATAPTLVNGIPYLAAAGNGRNWRYCGLVYVNISGNFVDSATERHLANFYNRLSKPLFTCPGYVDDNAVTTYTMAVAGAWAALNGGTGASVSFVSEGDEESSFIGNFSYIEGVAGTFYPGLALDAATDPIRTALSHYITTPSALYSAASLPYKAVVSNGRHVVYLVGQAFTATATINADLARYGATADIPMTYLQGSIKC